MARDLFVLRAVIRESSENFHDKKKKARINLRFRCSLGSAYAVSIEDLSCTAILWHVIKTITKFSDLIGY